MAGLNLRETEAIRLVGIKVCKYWGAWPLTIL